MQRVVRLKSEFLGTVLIAVLLVVGSQRLTAQIQDSASQPPPAHPPAASQEPSPDDSLETFKSQVNVVNLFFNV